MTSLPHWVVNVTVGRSSGYIYDLVLLKEMVDFPQGKSTTFGEFYRECSIFFWGAPIQEDPGRLFQGEPTEIEVTRLGKGALGGKAVLTWRSCDQFFVGKRKQQL